MRQRADLAEDRGQRLKALEEPAIGLRFRRDHRTEEMIQQETEALRSEAVAQRRQRREQRLLGAARPRLSLHITEEEVVLGGVACRRARPERPELVPKTRFAAGFKPFKSLESLLRWTSRSTSVPCRRCSSIGSCNATCCSSATRAWARISWRIAS